MAMLRANRDQILAFRLNSHHLTRRLPPGSLLPAAAACGIQNTPPGSAALALHARVEGLVPADLDRALGQDRTLLLLWSVRGAPYLVPTRDSAVFTVGALPSDEASFRVLLQGVAKPVEATGIPAAEALERTAAAMREALDGRVLSKGELSTEVTRRVPRELALWCAGCRVHHVPESLFRAVGLLGVICFAAGQGDGAGLVRTDQWLGAPLPGADPAEARAELVLRYLHCYGPSTPCHFADWALLSPAEAGRAFALIEGELVRVDAAGTSAWLPERDLVALASPPEPTGVRLLPPHDPYLQPRDRTTLLPDRTLHRRVWQPLGNPGVVLVDGRLVATWRPRKKGRRLLITVEPFERIPPAARPEIEAEAESLAPYRGGESAEVVFADSPAESGE